MVVLKCVGKSLVKLFLYYFLPELLRDCVPVSRYPWKQWLHSLCFVCSLLWHMSFIIFENYYIQWLLPLILGIFSASLTGSDDFVLFDSYRMEMFYVTFRFCANFPKLISQHWMETRLMRLVAAAQPCVFWQTNGCERLLVYYKKMLKLSGVLEGL